MQSTKKLIQQSVSLRVFSRGFASNSEATVARFHAYGTPISVKLEKEPIPDKLGESEVLVKMLLAPISPVDVFNIRGHNGPQTFPGTPGLEGVGEVVAVGSGVSDFKANDLVIPLNPKNGTWRTHLVSPADNLFRVPEKVTLEDAATISIAPVVALSLLNNFVKLSPGDFLIQNGADGAVGSAVIQVAAKRDIKTINIVRNKPNYGNVSARLQGHGAHIVISPEFLRLPKFTELHLEGSAPKLGLNLTGGRIATDVARGLAVGGTFVTYAGISYSPVTLPTSLFVNKNLTALGFSLRNVSLQDRKKLISEAFSLGVRSYVDRHRFTDLQSALKAHLAPERNRKIVLVFDK